MHAIHLETADGYGVPGDYVAGSTIAGFIQMADAMLVLGVVRAPVSRSGAGIAIVSSRLPSGTPP